MNLGYVEHHNVFLKCEEVYNEVKKEIKNKARILRNAGPIEDIWLTKRNLVEVQGWKTLKERLTETFQDDNDPLNKLRRKAADVFYGSKLIEFQAQFRDEIGEILKGNEVAKQDNLPSNSEGYDEIEEDLEESDGT